MPLLNSASGGLSGGHITIGTSQPGSAAAGDQWNDTSYSPAQVKIYTGAAWVIVGLVRASKFTETPVLN